MSHSLQNVISCTSTTVPRDEQTDKRKHVWHEQMIKPLPPSVQVVTLIEQRLSRRAKTNKRLIEIKAFLQLSLLTDSSIVIPVSAALCVLWLPAC